MPEDFGYGEDAVFEERSGENNNRQQPPVRIYQLATGPLKSSPEITQTGLPLRPSLSRASSSEPHKYKKRNWVLPEGQTVLEKSIRLKCKRTLRSESERCAQPNIDLYLDLFVRLRNLLLITAQRFDYSRKVSTNIDLKLSCVEAEKRLHDKERKVADLQELYIHQQHMKEGATRLIESLQQNNHHINQSKRIEECRLQRQVNFERLLLIEEEIAKMSGSLKFKILGLIGFSRVCPGDVYELKFKIGNQRWMSKCKIEVHGQRWIDPIFVFQADVSKPMSIKLSELGSFGKTTGIGSAKCYVKEFLGAEPKIFLIPINSIGTMKIRLGVAWSGLDNTDKKFLSTQKKTGLASDIDFTKAPVISLTSLGRNPPRPDKSLINVPSLLPPNTPSSSSSSSSSMTSLASPSTSSQSALSGRPSRSSLPDANQQTSFAKNMEPLKKTQSLTNSTTSAYNGRDQRTYSTPEKSTEMPQTPVVNKTPVSKKSSADNNHIVSVSASPILNRKTSSKTKTPTGGNDAKSAESTKNKQSDRAVLSVTPSPVSANKIVATVPDGGVHITSTPNSTKPNNVKDRNEISVTRSPVPVNKTSMIKKDSADSFNSSKSSDLKIDEDSVLSIPKPSDSNFKESRNNAVLSVTSTPSLSFRSISESPGSIGVTPNSARKTPNISQATTSNTPSTPRTTASSTPIISRTATSSTPNISRTVTSSTPNSISRTNTSITVEKSPVRQQHEDCTPAILNNEETPKTVKQPLQQKQSKEMATVATVISIEKTPHSNSPDRRRKSVEPRKSFEPLCDDNKRTYSLDRTVNVGDASSPPTSYTFEVRSSPKQGAGVTSISTKENIVSSTPLNDKSKIRSTPFTNGVFTAGGSVANTRTFSSATSEELSQSWPIQTPSMILSSTATSKKTLSKQIIVTRQPPMIGPPIGQKPRKTSKLGNFQENDLLDAAPAISNCINVCQRILEQLAKKSFQKEMNGELNDKMMALKHSLESFQNRQSRRPSFSESIVSALNRFDFLNNDEDDPSSTTTTNALLTPPLNNHESPVCYILPKQWQRVHRALFHHLCVVFDLIDLLERQLGPLDSMHKKSRDLISENLSDIDELMTLMSHPDDIVLRNICEKYVQSETLANTWEVSVATGQPLYCERKAIQMTLCALYNHVQSNEAAKHVPHVTIEEVCSAALRHLMGDGHCITDQSVITLFEFLKFFKERVRSNNVAEFLKDVRKEIIAIKGLEANDELVVKSTLQEFWEIPIVPSCMQSLFKLLSTGKTSIKPIIVNVLVNVNKQASIYFEEIISESIEHNNTHVKAGACLAVGELKLNSFNEKLKYIHDFGNTIVKNAADSAIKQLGVSS